MDIIKISVIMSCFNMQQYLQAAIESVIKQTYLSWELLIIEDGSTDQSRIIAEKYAEGDSRIRLIVNEYHMGVSASRNIGLEAARGEYIAFMNAGDIAMAKRLEKEMKFLDLNREYGAVGGCTEYIDRQGKIIERKQLPDKSDGLQAIMFFRNPFVADSIMVRKKVIDTYKIRFCEKLLSDDEYLFWIELSAYSKMFILRNIVSQCRESVHEENGNEITNLDKVQMHRYVLKRLWSQKKINISNKDCHILINILMGSKKTKSVLQLIQYIQCIIRYGFIVSRVENNKYIYEETKRCLKATWLNNKNISSIQKLYANKLIQLKCYKNQFREARESVKEYGNYPYPKYLVLPDKKLIYLEMPKVANCSIKGSMLKESFADDYSVQGEALKYTKHKLSPKYNDFYKFTFVRNPFERLVSCYESKYHKDKELIGVGLNELIFDNYLFGYLRKDRGFTNFVCKIVWIPDKYKDHHFKPQTCIAYNDGGRCCVDYIGKYECLNEEYGKIVARYELGELPFYNKTDHKNYMDYYNWLTVRVAYLIYRKDIKKFGYEREYQELKQYIKRKKTV